MSDTFKAISEKYQSLALNCPILGKDYIEFDKSKNTTITIINNC